MHHQAKMHSPTIVHFRATHLQESQLILNLTQHPATPAQTAVGVVDLPPEKRAALLALLTFDTLPGRGVIEDRAEQIALLANAFLDEGPDDYQYAMLGGAPFLMSPLERALVDQCIVPLYAFSIRSSDEQIQLDGSVRKVATFNHAGFVVATGCWFYPEAGK